VKLHQQKKHHAWQMLEPYGTITPMLQVQNSTAPSLIKCPTRIHLITTLQALGSPIPKRTWIVLYPSIQTQVNTCHTCHHANMRDASDRLGTVKLQRPTKLGTQRACLDMSWIGNSWQMAKKINNFPLLLQLRTSKQGNCFRPVVPKQDADAQCSRF